MQTAQKRCMHCAMSRASLMTPGGPRRRGFDRFREAFHRTRPSRRARIRAIWALSALGHGKACFRWELRNILKTHPDTLRIASPPRCHPDLYSLSCKEELTHQLKTLGALYWMQDHHVGCLCTRRRQQYGISCKIQGCPRLSSPVAPRSSLRSTVRRLPNGRGQSHIRVLLLNHRLYE